MVFVANLSLNGEDNSYEDLDCHQEAEPIRFSQEPKNSHGFGTLCYKYPDSDRHNPSYLPSLFQRSQTLSPKRVGWCPRIDDTNEQIIHADVSYITSHVSRKKSSDLSETRSPTGLEHPHPEPLLSLTNNSEEDRHKTARNRTKSQKFPHLKTPDTELEVCSLSAATENSPRFTEAGIKQSKPVKKNSGNLTELSMFGGAFSSSWSAFGFEEDEILNSVPIERVAVNPSFTKRSSLTNAEMHPSSSSTWRSKSFSPQWKNCRKLSRKLLPLQRVKASTVEQTSSSKA